MRGHAGTFCKNLKKSTIITDSLICWLDSRNPLSYGGSGTTWSDLSGNSNDGTLVGGIIQDVDDSLIFDGVNDYVTTSISTSLFTSGNATIQMWVKLDSATPTYSTSGCWGYGSSTVRSHYPYTNSVAYFDTFRTNRIDAIALDGAIDREDYHLITITSERGGFWKFYQNDTLLRTVSAQTNINFVNQTIGRSSSALSGVWFYLKGNIASVYIYNKSLSLTEIQNNLTINQAI